MERDEKRSRGQSEREANRQEDLRSAKDNIGFGFYTGRAFYWKGTRGLPGKVRRFGLFDTFQYFYDRDGRSKSWSNRTDPKVGVPRDGRQIVGVGRRVIDIWR